LPEAREEKVTEWLKRFYYLLILALVLYLVYLLRDVLVPFVLGGLLAYALTPAARFLNKRGLPWKLSVVIVFLALLLFFALLFFLIIPEALSQLKALASSAPRYIEDFVGKILEAARALDARYPELRLAEAVEDFLRNFLGNFESYLQTITKNILNLVSLFMSVLFLGFVVTPFALYYFMVDAAKIRGTLVRILPRERHREYIELLRDVDRVVGNFIRGRLILSLFVGSTVTVGLLAMGIEFPLVIGIIAGIADVIPYLGPIVGAIPALLFASTKSLWHVVGVVALFSSINFVEGVVVTPRVMGKETGLHPVTVLFALLVGGKLFGALGVIAAIPVAGVLKGILLHQKKAKKKATEHGNTL